MTDRLRLLATRSDNMWWEIGELLDEISMRGMLPPAFENVAVFAEAEIGLSATAALRFRRVAHHFSRDTAMRFGARHLDLLLQYLDAMPKVCSVIDVLRLDIVVRVDGNDVLMPFSETSEEDMADAVWRARQRQSTVDSLIPPEVAESRDRLANALAVAAPNVRIKVHHDVSEGLDEFSLAVVGIDPFTATSVGKAIVAEGKVLTKIARQR